MTDHTRALLEQAMNALLLPCDRWNKQQFKIVTAAAEAIRAELAKPVESSYTAVQLAAMVLSDCGISTDYAALHMLVAARIARHEEELIDSLQKLAKRAIPAWHDAPTEPGIWLCDEGGPDCYTYTAHNIVLLNDPALKDDECRWYGPIPQDGAKAEGGEA